MPIIEAKTTQVSIHSGHVLQVMDRSDLNKMTSSNLAVLFGPNIIWSQSGQLSLSAIAPINMFTDFVLVHHDQIFII